MSIKIAASAGNPEIAMVYVVDFDGKYVECVEAIQPPKPREEKWVLMVSTLFGCPVTCQICDAGGHYRGKLTDRQILDQIHFLIDKRYPAGIVPSRQFKIQFARMGEPALNIAVLDALRKLAEEVKAPGLMPSLSTIAPYGTEDFFEGLLDVKNEYYPGGKFQFQYSIHTTDQKLRDQLIPVRKLGFKEMAEFGERFVEPGDRKVTLNFALAEDSPVDPSVLKKYFDPEKFLIKITPLNPTYQAEFSGLESYLQGSQSSDQDPLVENLQQAGYQVILSIGELEENSIGSNCGQYVQKHLEAVDKLGDGYTYQVESWSE
jgi:23S rRNA (adenine2503-C2)-methyltransferase